MAGHTSQMVHLLQIREPAIPDRLSFDPDTLGALADDIAANGLLQPIGLIGPSEDGTFEIAFGHRRFRAVRLLNRDMIEAKIWPLGTDVMTARASENLNRDQLTPVEEAHIVARYIKRGDSRSAIARYMRRSPAWVESRLAILDLPDELQDAVHHGDLALSVALHLAGVDHAPYRKQLVQEAVQNGATLNTVRVWVAHYEADRGRIITNELAVQEIIEARRAFVPYYQCENCSQGVPFHDTRAFRFCIACARAIAETITPAQPAP